MVKLSLVLYDDTLKRGQHCTMYYTHLYDEIRKLIILLYRVFDNMLANTIMIILRRMHPHGIRD